MAEAKREGRRERGEMGTPMGKRDQQDIGPRSSAVRAWLDSKPGALAEPASAPGARIYKVMGKMFAILTTRTLQHLIAKTRPWPWLPP